MSRIPKFASKCPIQSHTSDDVPQLPVLPKRQPFLRRSKSHSDLRTVHYLEHPIRNISCSTRKPLSALTTQTSSIMTALDKKFGSRNALDKVPELPTFNKRPLAKCRRSKSFTDMRPAEPLSITTVKPHVRAVVKNSTQSAVSSGYARNQNNHKTTGASSTNNLPSRTGTKRQGETSEPVVKNKIVKKTPKVPTWDYKTRFGILNEKHIALVEEFKNAEKNLEEANEIAQRNTSLTAKVSDLEHILEQTKNELATYKKNFSEAEKNLKLKEKLLEEEYARTREMENKNRLLMSEVEELKNEVLKKNFDIDCLKKEFETLQEVHEKSCQRNEDLNSENELLKIDVFNGEKTRRALHNTIQDLKGNIRVFCRLRPPLSEQERHDTCNFNFPSEKTIEISKSRGSIAPGGVIKSAEPQEFTFDRVFGQETRQLEIFEELAQLIQSALDGYHVCVFAYGQTGSGKTYTMQGEQDPECLGMIPRSINLIFQTKEEMEKKGWSYTIHASFLEIYNENIRDLLDMKSDKPLEICYNMGKGTTVSNLTILPIETAEELTSYMFKAQQNRSTAVTNFNEHSSRSHAVTKIYIESHHQQATLVGSVSLVDLAGSESAKSATIERLAETKNINKSLSSLGNVMLALHKRESHIPYRNSKLTYLLQSSLGGNCKCLMVVNISPNEECFNESINALRFASKVKEVRVNTSRNRVANSTTTPVCPRKN